MNLELELEFNNAQILLDVDALKAQINELRPLPPEVEGKVMQKLRLEWNYNSNAIEGNKLSYGETTALLMHGITAKGKPLKDHLDIKGHNKAVEYLETIIKDEREFTQMDIRGLHEVILGEEYNSPAQTFEGLATYKQIQIGKYKSMPNHVETITGEIHYYATPEETPAKMNDLMEWYDKAKMIGIHPVVIAALFHHRFVAIHPFDDGNGRMARIIMNLILMKNGYPPVVVKKADKHNYYALLSQSDSGDDWPFIEYITELTQNSLQLYLKAINGGDIDEDEDIDKEIALLKMQLTGGVIAKEKKSKVAIVRVFNEAIHPLAQKILEKSQNFNDYFFTNRAWFDFEYIENGRRYIPELGINDVPTVNYATYLNKLNVATRLNFSFQEYKDPKNTFHLNVTFQILFEEYYYNLLINEKRVLSKLYHENPSSSDQSIVIKNFIEDFKVQLSEKLKGLES